MSAVTIAPTAFADAFAARTGSYGPLRHEAWERLQAIGLPHGRLEDWRFSNPSVITGARFADGGSAGPAVEFPEDAPKARDRDTAALVGTIAPWQERGFVALNTALLGEPTRLYVGKDVDGPVRLRYAPARANGLAASHPRALIVVAPATRVTIFEDFTASQVPGSWVNAVTEIVVGEGADVEHLVLLDDVPGALHTGAMFATLEKDAWLASRSIVLGGRFTRRDMHVTLRGPGAETQLDGLYVAAGDGLVDHHTTVDHAVPSCTSRELFKGVLAGASRAVFNGAVIIRPGAQKSDASQQNQNLLLSEDATIDTKPELQIFADDVKCAHGATVGQLDEAALFYLRARGIGADQAKSILTHAFAREVVDRIPDRIPHEGLRDEVEPLVQRRMETLR